MHHHFTVRREAVAFLTALLAYSLFYAAFFHQAFLGDNLIAPSDSLDFGVAAYLATPVFWTQGMFSGYPIAADPQGLTWYPVLQLFRALGAHWNTFLISAYVVTSATTFLLVRRLTGSSLAGVFSGLVCGFSGMMVGYIANFNQIHAFAWVPLVLYGLQLIRAGLYRPGAAVTAMAAALMWLAGHPQVPVYAMYLAVGLVAGGMLIDRPSTPDVRRRLAWSGAALALGLALAAIVFVPMLELGRYSSRADSSWELFSSSALPLRELLTLIWPFALGGFWTESGAVPSLGETGDSGYTGLLPVALALAAPLVLSRHRGEARLWVGLAVFETLLSLGPATPLSALMYYAPGYSAFQAPLRHLFLVSLCLAVGSGLAFAELTGRRTDRRTVALAVAVVTVVAALGFAVFAWRTEGVGALIEEHMGYAPWSIGWPLVLAATLGVLALLAQRLPESRVGAVAFGMVLVAAQAGDLMMMHYRMPGRRFVYADVVREETALHPKMVALRAELERTGERVLATDGSRNAFLLPNLTRAWRVPAASGTGALAIERYLEVLGMGTSGDVPAAALSTAHRGLDLLAVRYALVRQGSSLAEEMARVADRWQPVESLHYYEDDPDTHYTLYRSRRAMPRAWCVSDVHRIGPSDTLAAIRGERLPDGSNFDPSRAVLVEPGELDEWQQSQTRAPGTAVSDGTRNQYLVNSDAPCLLVLSEVYYPWWRASIDDEPAELVRVNHTLLGLTVPRGSHIVRLWIAPVSVWAGAGITGLSLLLWSLLVLPLRPGLRRPGVVPS